MTTTAQRLARNFIAKQGYVEGTVEEALSLGDACDHVLTRSDGMTFSIVCVVDAESDASKRFDVEREAVKQILDVCCERYAGTLGGAKQPTALVVVEVRGSSTRADLERLRGYSNRLFDRNAIHAFVVDCSSAEVLTATRFSWLAGVGWRRFLRREMAGQG